VKKRWIDIFDNLPGILQNDKHRERGEVPDVLSLGLLESVALVLATSM
jgi:hypothetical protein